MKTSFIEKTPAQRAKILLTEMLIVFVGATMVGSGIFETQAQEKPAVASEDNTPLQDAVDVANEKPTGIAPFSVTPERFVIPSLNINAPVSAVQQNRVGNMAIPEDYDSVAWYEPGYKPGEQGNAVIAGHLDNSLGLSGVFKNLEKIEIGETFSVIGQNGEELTFRVTAKNVYDFRDAPLAKIYGESEKSSVNLISCTGEWLSDLGTYKDRLIVTGEFVEASE